MRTQLKIRTAYGLVLVLIVAFASVTLGCKGSHLGEKRWGGGPLGQGSSEQQKARAVYFDPYPLNDIGPEVVGGRPRGFQNPLPEATRNELKNPLANPWAGYGR
jgi:hypothetical protein